MSEKFKISNLDLYYGDFHALKDINMSIHANEITAFIGPSGCGKSTFLKSLNRMNDLVEGSQEMFCWMARTSTKVWMSTFYEKESAWYSRSQIRSR